MLANERPTAQFVSCLRNLVCVGSEIELLGVLEIERQAPYGDLLRCALYQCRAEGAPSPCGVEISAVAFWHPATEIGPISTIDEALLRGGLRWMRSTERRRWAALKLIARIFGGLLVTSDAPDIRTRLAVEDAIVRMFVATDERDWVTLQDCFSSPFTLDMTSMVDGTPAVLHAPAGGEHSGQMVSNHQTRCTIKSATFARKSTESRLWCVGCGVALHHRGAATGIKSRVFVGTYEIRLSQDGGKWRIVIWCRQVSLMETLLEESAYHEGAAQQSQAAIWITIKCTRVTVTAGMKLSIVR